MNILVYILIGLCIGSFLNVCIYRIPREESISFPPSHCTSCGYRLKLYDLIPVLSYLFLKGKCRNCGEKISIQYPILELTNAVLYLGIYLKYGMTIESVKLCILSSLLLVIGIIDFKTKDVYTSIIITGAIIGCIFLGFNWYITKELPCEYILGAICSYLLLYAIYFFTGGMGQGDAEIAGICGLFLGLKFGLLTLFLSVILGGIVCIFILICKIKDKKDEIAFGPYIAMGAFITMFIGNRMINLYISFF